MRIFIDNCACARSGISLYTCVRDQQDSIAVCVFIGSCATCDIVVCTRVCICICVCVTRAASQRLRNERHRQCVRSQRHLRVRARFKQQLHATSKLCSCVCERHRGVNARHHQQCARRVASAYTRRPQEEFRAASQCGCTETSMAVCMRVSNGSCEYAAAST